MKRDYAYQKRPVIRQETYICEKRPFKETYIYGKRPTYVKRDPSKRPTYMERDLYIWKETYIYE